MSEIKQYAYVETVDGIKGTVVELFDTDPKYLIEPDEQSPEDDATIFVNEKDIKRIISSH